MAEIEYPLHFIRRDGYVWTAETAAIAAGKGADRKHREVIRRYDLDGTVAYEQVVESDWIARDSFGAVIVSRDIPDEPRTRVSARERREAEVRKAAERGLPIPETGRKGRRGSRGPYRRSAPYMGERRDGAAFARDLAEEALYARMIVRLRKVGPAPYEDGEWRKTERGWKNQRMTKWKTR